MHPNVHCSTVYTSLDTEATWMCAVRGMDKDTVDYYSAIKKNEIMPFAATWMDLQIAMLSEVNHSEKEKYHMTSTICGI